MTDNIEESKHTEESKKTSLKKSAEKLTEEIQSMANYKSLYTEIQVHTKYPIIQKFLKTRNFIFIYILEKYLFII